MALDSLRSALRHPSDALLGYARRQLLWWRNRCVRTQFHFGRCDRRLRSGMAADCGGVLCAADCIPADRRIILYEILAMNVPPMKRDISGPTERLLDLPQKLQFILNSN